MKRALVLTALFVVGLLSALTLAGGGIAGYTHTHTYTTTGTTTETVPTEETTATVLCPNGNPNTGGKDGHPGNDSCALDETTPPQLTISVGTATQGTTTETVTTSTPPETTTETTETTVTEATSPPPTPPVKPRRPPHRQHVKPSCKNGTPRVNGRCHPIVRGSG